MEDLSSRHRKELKSLEGERRASIKKAKSIKGKKGKDALALAESEYNEKERVMKERHALELAQAVQEERTATTATATAAAEEIQQQQQQQDDTGTTATTNTGLLDTNENQQRKQQQQQQQEEQDDDKEVTIKQRKQAKARAKRMKQKQKQTQREMLIQHELDTMGPTPREMEIQALIELYLSPRNLQIHEIPADGNCLYRAIAHQYNLWFLHPTPLPTTTTRPTTTRPVMMTHVDLRVKCAQMLRLHRTEYEPFAELDHHHVKTFDEYIDNVQNSSEWGGQLEIRALCSALQCTIVVYSADSAPLIMRSEYDNDDHEGGNHNAHGKEEEEDEEEDGKCLRISFHKRYYALGEHYNSVVPKDWK